MLHKIGGWFQTERQKTVTVHYAAAIFVSLFNLGKLKPFNLVPKINPLINAPKIDGTIRLGPGYPKKHVLKSKIQLRSSENFQVKMVY